MIYCNFQNAIRYKAGVNSESGRTLVQNRFHDVIGSPHFKNLGHPTVPYSSVGQHYNPYSLW